MWGLGTYHAMLDTRFEALKADYAACLERCVILQPDTVHRLARHLASLTSRYEAVSRATAVPVPWLLAIDYHESSNDPKTYLGNGDPIIGTGRRTVNVPAGRGPFSTWDDGALDALVSLHGAGPWSLVYGIWQAERWNGFGYRRHNTPSAYLWGSTDIYIGGGFPADGKWDPNYHTRQIGVVPLFAVLGELGLSFPEDALVA